MFTIRRFTLDANHAWISLLVFAVSAVVALMPANAAGWRVGMRRGLHLVVGAGLGLAAVSGILMFAKISALVSLTRPAYTGLEMGLAVALTGSAAILILRLIRAAVEAPAISGGGAPAGGS